MAGIEILQELLRTSSLLFEDRSRTSLVATLVEQAQDVSGSDSAVLYAYPGNAEKKADLTLIHKRGKMDLPRQLPADGELVRFMEDCREALVLNSRGQVFFSEAFLHKRIRSVIVLPLFTPKRKIGLLILGAVKENFYGKNKLHYLDAFTRLAGGMINNTELFQEVKEKLKEIEALQRYQESVFTSMTNLLITTDARGNIHYFNKAAADRLLLDSSWMGKSLYSFVEKSMGTSMLQTLSKAQKDYKEILGLEGIYKREGGDMDFSLNISPLTGKRGKYEGLTLLFTDQSREQELKNQMNVAVEERRVIKDMFARYMSGDVLKSLMDSADQVHLGGDRKMATLFFADIRGYTSFSEGKEPEVIVDILNEYFSEAVEIIIKYNGYIDKFIGDCIMAAWGVPIVKEDKDAVAAVSCAVEIQELVRSKSRKFFKGIASGLKVGIGMHSGPLVAGNLGSQRRMDYSVIGDTVNIAARLEGVAAAGEVIITQRTRDLIGDHFKLKELDPVKVKGVEKPLHIFNVMKVVH